MGGDEEEIERSLRRSNETVPYLFCLLRVTALTFLGNKSISAPRAIFCIQRQKAVFGRGALVQLFQPRYSLARRNAALQQTPKTPARAASQYEHRYDSSNNMNNSNIDKNSTIDHAT